MFTTTLSGASDGTVTRYIDFVREYRSGVLHKYAIIVNQTNVGSSVDKVDFSGNILSNTKLYVDSLKTAPLSSFGSNLQAWKSITGYQFLRKWKIDKTPSVTCRFSVQNLYENEVVKNTFSEYYLGKEVNKLSPGWHSFCFVFNAELAKFSLHVDGVECSSLSFPTNKARYSFLEAFKQPLTFGTTPHLSNEILSMSVKQTDAGFCEGIRIKDVTLHDLPMSNQNIKFLSNKLHDVLPVVWNVPCGQRNFIETVERFFKFNIPGHKSDTINMVIENTYILNKTIRADIEQRVRDTFTKFAPSNVTLNKVIFRENEK